MEGSREARKSEEEVFRPAERERKSGERRGIRRVGELNGWGWEESRR